MEIKKVISQMTLEEKASLCSGSDFWHTQPVERVGVAAVMVSDGPHGLRKQPQDGDHLGIADSIEAVCFPAACATAASFDREIMLKMGETLGDTCQHEQVSVLLGPAVNIKRSPLCGRNFEYFSEDPYLTAELATVYTNAVQSRHIGVSIKHFAANNQEHRRMSSNSVVDERTLREIYYPAFEKVVKEADPKTVMCAYNRVNGSYASENHTLLTKVLRDEWGFKGYVMSDWGAVSDRVASLKAGMELEMPASGGMNDALIVQAVKEGRLDESVLDTAVERLLSVNEWYLKNAKPETPWDKEAQHVMARSFAAECMVLLKNERDILPLAEGEDIAVIGHFAKKPRFQGGGSSHINAFKTTSLMDALEGVKGIRFAQGYDVVTEAPDEALIAQAVECAKGAKDVVIVAGLPDAFESEGYDRAHLRLPACQDELIARVAKANPHTVVVLYNGSPVLMPWLSDVQAVVEAYIGGQAVGGATCDVLFGKVNPSGRLPESFPLKLSDTPSYLTYGGEGDYALYNEGVFVGYRYYDKKEMEVLFPFGFGLSYTDFAYSNLRLDKMAIQDTDTLTVMVDVKNIGKVAGKEVVQLYIGDKESTVFRPIRELKGFEKVSLKPGELKTVTFKLDKRAFAYWNTTLNDWHVETGAFAVEIGKSSREIALEAEVIVTSTQAIPVRYTQDSIFQDLMTNPVAVAALTPLFEGMLASIGIGSTEEESEKSPISNDMLQAMLRCLPLRAVVSFSGGKLTNVHLDAILAQINQG